MNVDTDKAKVVFDNGYKHGSDQPMPRMGFTTGRDGRNITSNGTMTGWDLHDMMVRLQEISSLKPGDKVYVLVFNPEAPDQAVIAKDVRVPSGSKPA